MAKARSITKRAVDALRCPSGHDRVFLWDDTLPGFGVAAFPSGNKVYVVQYRQSGKSRRMSLGAHGRLTPDTARTQAKKILGAVADRKDPLAERRAPSGKTLEAVANDYLRLHVRPKRKARTAEEYERLLKLHIVPALGARAVKDIRRVDVERLHSAMSETPGAANRAIVLLTSIWNWAAEKDESLSGRNPGSGVERYAEKSRERYLSEGELARLGKSLRLAETKGIPWNVDESSPGAKHVPKQNRVTVLDPRAVAAILLLILTGARLREILHAQWAFVDWQRNLLLLPDSKSGRKTIYLSQAAMGVLQRLRNLPGNGKTYIFPGQPRRRGRSRAVEREQPRADLKKPWAAIARHAGLKNVRLHDLRHTYAATGAGASLGLPVIGKLLGHTQPATTARYAHLDASPMHRAANLIGGHIGAAMKLPNGDLLEEDLPQE